MKKPRPTGPSPSSRWLAAALLSISAAMAPLTAWSQEEDPPEGEEAVPGEAGQEATEPGADAPGGEPDADSPAVRPPEAVLPPRPGADAQTIKELEEFQKVYLRYQQEIEAYRTEVNAIVESEYERKRQEIEAVYDKEIRSLEVVERERRQEAIAALEEFLGKYPNHPRYTPDVLYRLAELYFEKANDDYLVADEEYQSQLELYDRGRIADPPESPERSYARTIGLFERLIGEFPDYRYIDGAYYLLGFCRLRQGEDVAAKEAFVTLVQRRPDSRFVAEAWLRIGEYHFDYNELDQAIAAYSNTLNYPENEYYDKALYKLAWTYYRSDRFDLAIKTFKELVRFADEKLAETGKGGSELRPEAIQYLAISLAEEDWDGDGSPDPEFGMTRVNKYLEGKEPYEREVLVKLADILFDNTRYEEAIEIYRLALAKYPLEPENPKVHDKLIIALQRLRRFDEAFAERRQLGIYYGPGSTWYDFQQREGNVEALSYADSLARDNLIESATWYHEQAQKLADDAVNSGDSELELQSRDKFSRAARTYGEYLEKYPNDKEAYKWRFYRAECLYYSLQFLPAADAYAEVRDLSVGNNKYREPSAFNGIKAVEYTIAEQIKAGTLPPESLPQASLKDQAGDAEPATPDGAGADGGEGRGDKVKAPIVARELPELVVRLNQERHRYVELGLESPTDPYLPGKLEFQAAKAYYDFRQLPEARQRFEAIISAYEGQEVSVFAAALILESFVLEQDYDKMAEWAEKIASNPKLSQGDRAQEVRKEARRLKLGAMFKKADELMDGGKFEEAAEAYIQLINEDPKNTYADKALNNAAVAYENVKRYDSAMKLYERVYREHPDSPLAPTALFRVAFNAERFFDFEKAVSSYLLLVEKYGKSESRETSLRRAGVILENLQNYRQAAEVYARFANEFPASPDAPLALYQAALVHEKMGDYPKMIKTLREFNGRYGVNPAYNRQVMTGLDKMATYQLEKKRDPKAAKKAFEEVVREYSLRGIQPGSFEAQYGARAQFYLAEFEFDKWDKIQLRGSLKKQEGLLKEKFNGAKALRPRYEAVYDYRNLEWTMAAGYRTANILQRFADALYNADVPFEEGSEEYDVYKVSLEDVAVPLEDEAVADYEKTIAKAREAKINNAWTKKILEQLNGYKPADYPLFHEEKRATREAVVTSLPPMDPATLARPEVKAPGAAPPASDDDK